MTEKSKAQVIWPDRYPPEELSKIKKLTPKEFRLLYLGEWGPVRNDPANDEANQ